MYDNKIALVIREDLQTWKKLNVTAFLASSVAIKFPYTYGKEFINASYSVYLPFMKHPVLIYKAENEAGLKRTFKRAKERELHIGIYTESLFGTKNEDENHIEMAKYTDDEQALAGIVVYGETRKVNKAIDGLKLHS